MSRHADKYPGTYLALLEIIGITEVCRLTRRYVEYLWLSKEINKVVDDIRKLKD